MANDLALPSIADGQADGQWQSSNDGDDALANAVQDIYTADFTSGDVTLTAAQFRSAMTFVPSNLGANQALTIAAVKRAQFIVHNTDATYTITVTKGSTTIDVTPGQIGIFWTDGTTNSLEGFVRDEGAFNNGLQSDTSANLTAGYTATAHDAGTKSSGTFTPDPADGNFQRYVNGGAHTLAPPSVGSGDSVSMVLQVTNNASAGAITTSGFTIVTGDTLTTTDGDDFMLHATVVNGFSHLNVVALQ